MYPNRFKRSQSSRPTKRQRTVAFPKRPRALRFGQTTTRCFKLKMINSVVADGAGVLKLSYYNDPSGATDWSSIQALFDVYRVVGVKIKFIPQTPNDTSTTRAFLPLYVAGDQDSATNPFTASTDPLHYENCKVANMYQPWSYYMKMQNRSQVANAGTSITLLQGGWQDCATSAASAGIYTYGTNFTASAAYGTMVTIWYVEAKDRR